MVATDMCGKTPSRGSGCMGLRENIHFLTIFFVFYQYYYLYYYMAFFTSSYLIITIIIIT